MGCGISKFDIPKEGDTSQLYTRFTIVHGANDRAVVIDGSLSSRHVPICDGGYHKRGNVGKEEACIDEESSSVGDLNDRDDGISYMASPSFRVYCVPSPLDDGYSEGDCNPDEIMEDQKIEFQNYKKRSSGGYGKSISLPRKQKKGFRNLCFRHVCQSS